jgi:hypothetical protein
LKKIDAPSPPRETDLDSKSDPNEAVAEALIEFAIEVRRRNREASETKPKLHHE